MRNRYYLLLDFALAIVATLAAFSARFEGTEWWSAWGDLAIRFMVLAIPAKIAIFVRVGLYGRLWRYASTADLELLLVASLASALGTLLLGSLVLPVVGILSQRIPFGVLTFDAV